MYTHQMNVSPIYHSSSQRYCTQTHTHKWIHDTDECDRDVFVCVCVCNMRQSRWIYDSIRSMQTCSHSVWWRVLSSKCEAEILLLILARRPHTQNGKSWYASPSLLWPCRGVSQVPCGYLYIVRLYSVPWLMIYTIQILREPGNRGACV